jgi:hypothetical protein
MYTCVYMRRQDGSLAPTDRTDHREGARPDEVHDLIGTNAPQIGRKSTKQGFEWLSRSCDPVGSYVPVLEANYGVR